MVTGLDAALIQVKKTVCVRNATKKGGRRKPTLMGR